MSVINTNVKSLVAQNAAVANGRAMSKAMEQLSTGKRINTAADDAAGLAISSKMTSQIKGLNQAIRNANDGISLLQTAEGATQEITNMLQRMRELAVQAANGTNDVSDRSGLNLEVTALKNEIDRISNNTEWNGMKIFTNSATAIGGANGGSAQLQVGVDGTATDRITVKFDKLTTTGTIAGGSGLGINAVSLSTMASAQSALATLDSAIAAVNTDRARFGATINRLTFAADNLANISTNAQESRSRILDTDYAQTTTELARTQIIQQAATAMLAQANQAPQTVLSLLR
jgi:flagellin